MATTEVQFGTDLSHYDGHITLAIAKAMKASGLVFASHKIGEGTGGDDAEDKTALANLRDAGFEFLGGYHVTRSVSVSAQIKGLLALANRDEPWWKEFPGWFWQIDMERWPYDSVPAHYGIDMGKALREETGKPVFMYASRGQYGDQLKDWDGLLWNADYGVNRTGDLRAIYPGNSYRGWNAYSGKVPTFLQYGSRAIVAGLTTTDADAFRGSLADLRKIITGKDSNVQLDADDKAFIEGAVKAQGWHSAQFDPTLDAAGKAVVPTKYTKSPATHLLRLETALNEHTKVLAAQGSQLTEILNLLKAAPAPASAPLAGDLQVTGTIHVEPPAAS